MLCLFYKIWKGYTPPYLQNVIPISFQIFYSSRPPLFRVKHSFFKISYFPSTIIELNNLDYSLRNVPSSSAFKQNIFKFIRLVADKIYNVHNPSRLKLLTRLCLSMKNHLRVHNFSHNVSNCLDELCIYRINVNYSLVVIIRRLQTSGYSMQQLNTSYRQKDLIFLFQ